MKAVLVRVGMDSTPESGSWIAPVSKDTHEFVYVPIVENEGLDRRGVKTKPIRPGYEQCYAQFQEPCKKLCKELPAKLRNKRAHLDPDFRWLTYGDAGGKATQLTNAGLVEGDLLVFYAGLKPIDSPHNATCDLIYAIIGIYVLEGHGMQAKNTPEEKWHMNAHTRREPKDDDIVFFGKKGLSGRLKKCIPIGKCIGSRYWLKDCFFDKWGGFSFPSKVVTRLYLQRSGALPLFREADKFYQWFKEQDVLLTESNNISDE